jgi:hypothetical protein
MFMQKTNLNLIMKTRLAKAPITRAQPFCYNAGDGLITLLLNIKYNKTLTEIYSRCIIPHGELVKAKIPDNLSKNQQTEILKRLKEYSNQTYAKTISHCGRICIVEKKIRGILTFNFIRKIYLVK